MVLYFYISTSYVLGASPHFGHPEFGLLGTASIYFFSSTSNTSHMHFLIHMYIQGFNFNKDGTFWLFFITTFHSAFVV